MLKPRTIFSTVVVMLIAVITLPALAQSGSRICGYLAKKEKIAISYEARKKEAFYSRTCKSAMNEIKDKINKDPKLKNLKWTSTHKATCESVGSFLVKKGENTDICQKMKANCAYIITTNPKTLENTFKKISCK